MKELEKIKIIELRKQGLSYGQIGEKLSIPRSSVSSFFKREGIDDVNMVRECRNCKGMFILVPKVKKKIFCSNECRVNWWNNNQDKVKRKAIYNLVCLKCKKEFSTYGNSKQKYCSNACYIGSRYE